MAWRIIHKRTEPHWLEVEASDGSATVGEDGIDTPVYTYHATAKWDGCVDFRRFFNGEPWSDDDATADYLHICDLRATIELLQELERVATAFFHERYPEEWPLRLSAAPAQRYEQEAQ